MNVYDGCTAKSELNQFKNTFPCAAVGVFFVGILDKTRFVFVNGTAFIILFLSLVMSKMSLLAALVDETSELSAISIFVQHGTHTHSRSLTHGTHWALYRVVMHRQARLLCKWKEDRTNSKSPCTVCQYLPNAELWDNASNVLHVAAILVYFAYVKCVRVHCIAWALSTHSVRYRRNFTWLHYCGAIETKNAPNQPTRPKQKRKQPKTMRANVEFHVFVSASLFAENWHSPIGGTRDEWKSKVTREYCKRLWHLRRCTDTDFTVISHERIVYTANANVYGHNRQMNKARGCSKNKRGFPPAIRMSHNWANAGFSSALITRQIFSAAHPCVLSSLRLS